MCENWHSVASSGTTCDWDGIMCGISRSLTLSLTVSD